MLAIVIALLKGMSLNQVIDGIGNGLRCNHACNNHDAGNHPWGISAETGGVWPVDLLGDRIPYYALPATLLVITIVTSILPAAAGELMRSIPACNAFGYYTRANIANPELYLSICFACVLNGGVFGDQCSPISDTTILSATTIGCDLMDHVKTQFEPALYTVGLSAVLWTACAVVIA